MIRKTVNVLRSVFIDPTRDAVIIKSSSAEFAVVCNRRQTQDVSIELRTQARFCPLTLRLNVPNVQLQMAQFAACWKGGGSAIGNTGPTTTSTRRF